MNSFSLSKLSDLVQGNGHEIVEIFIYKQHVRYAIMFCKRFRQFFAMEIHNIPISYQAEKLSRHNCYGLYQTEKPVFKSTNSYNTESDFIKKQFLQKERLQSVFKHSFLSMLWFLDGKLCHDKYFYQIENFGYPENYMIWCVSLDDYYIHQSKISFLLHERYSKIIDFISKNVTSQFKVLEEILMYKTQLSSLFQEFQTKQAKFESQFHQVSAMFQRSPSSETRYKIIQLIHQLFRKQSEYFLMNEDHFFNILFHTSSIKEILNIH